MGEISPGKSRVTAYVKIGVVLFLLQGCEADGEVVNKFRKSRWT